MLGQRKLLDRLVPGPDARVHLLGLHRPLPDDPDRDDRRRRPAPDHPWLGAQGWFAALADLFVALVLLGVVTAVVIRKVVRPAAVRGQPPWRGRPDPGADRGRRDHAGCWHGARIAAGLNEWPAGWSPLSQALSHLFGERHNRARARARVRLGAPGVRPRLPCLPAALEAPAHRHGGRERVLREDAARRAARAAALRRARRADPVRRRHRRRPDLEGDRRRLLVHRVRALPGRLPGSCDREAALAEAPDHGRARPGLRRGAARARGRGGPDADRRQRCSRGDDLGLRHLRGVRGGVPGLDRARRPHRRPAPAARDGRLELPGRGGADAA